MFISKKVIRLFLLAIVCFIVFQVYAAIVKEQVVNLKKVNFNLEAGDKIYVFDKEATKLRIYGAPPGTKKYYLKVPEGKMFEGTWTLRDK